MTRSPSDTASWRDSSPSAPRRSLPTRGTTRHRVRDGWRVTSCATWSSGCPRCAWRAPVSRCRRCRRSTTTRSGAWVGISDALQAALDDPEVATREFDMRAGRVTVEYAIDTFCVGDIAGAHVGPRPRHRPRRDPRSRRGAQHVRRHAADGRGAPRRAATTARRSKSPTTPTNKPSSSPSPAARPDYSSLTASRDTRLAAVRSWRAAALARSTPPPRAPDRSELVAICNASVPFRNLLPSRAPRRRVRAGSGATRPSELLARSERERGGYPAS